MTWKLLHQDDEIRLLASDEIDEIRVLVKMDHRFREIYNGKPDFLAACARAYKALEAKKNPMFAGF